MERGFVNPYFKKFVTGSIVIWILGSVITSILSTVNIILGLLFSIVVGLFLTYFLFLAMARMSEDIVNRKFETEASKNEMNSQFNTSNSEIESVNELDINDDVVLTRKFDHDVIKDSNLIKIPNEEITIYEVSDEDRSGEFILQDGDIRLASPIFRRKHGDKWVKGAENYLDSEVIE